MPWTYNPFSGKLDFYKAVSSTPTVSVVYFGDPSTDGTWRITTSGNNLIQERLEGGVWVEKVAATP